MTVHRTQSEIRLAIKKLEEEFESIRKDYSRPTPTYNADKARKWIMAKINHEEEMLERRIREDQERERGERK